MTETPPAAPSTVASLRGPAPRWMWIVLVISVALNLLVLGAATAAFVHFHWGHDGSGGPGGPGGPRGELERFIAELPAERQKKLRAIFDERRSRVRPLRRELRRARRRARDAFIAEPFDRDALVRAYEDAAKARVALTHARQRWFERLAEAMNLEERRAFLKLRPHRRGRRRRGDRDR